MLLIIWYLIESDTSLLKKKKNHIENISTTCEANENVLFYGGKLVDCSGERRLQREQLGRERSSLFPGWRSRRKSRHEERLLRPKALALGAQGKNALISAKNAEIRQIEPFAVRLAEAVPKEEWTVFFSPGKRPLGTEINGIEGNLTFTVPSYVYLCIWSRADEGPLYK